MVFFIFWVLSGFVGYMIGKDKGEGTGGAVLGLLLGPIGWIIVALSKGDRKECPHCKSKINKAATTCPSCGKGLGVTSSPLYRSPALPDAAPALGTKLCPFCAEDIKAAAIVCKHCGKDLPTAA